jgi:protease-4
MKQFFKFMFASMLGFILGSVVLFFIMLAIVSGMMLAFKGDNEVSVSDNSVLQLSFENPIEERTGKNPFENLDLSNLSKDPAPGLDEILKSINKAKTDDRIKGILLDLSSVRAGLATLEEIRNALLDFKKSNKFIYAYSESFTQGAYYLASLSDSIYLYPEGDFDFKGLHATLSFFKGALDKLEVKPEIIRHGKFKSAVEPFMYDKMSDENRQQVMVLLSGVWNSLLNQISLSRNIPVSELQRIADGLEARNPEDALRLKLVDHLAYYDEVLSSIKKKTGLGEKDKAKFISLSKYVRVFVKGDDFSAKKIAVVYASGEIVSGKGSDDQVGSERIAEALRKARLDTTVKAIVFRVNSPGGSALASDVIWRETMLAKRAKPFIVSMGDYAASGGYYISCAADTIVARPNTITGSIGVFGLLFNAQEMFKNKLGVTFDTVKTARYADMGELVRPMKDDERNIIQSEVEKIYDTFITHVANGRKMSKTGVDDIGQGRIWTGTDAKRLGLVDVLGGLNDAIDIAAKKANLSKYRTIALPEQKEFLEQLMQDLNSEAKASFAKQELGEAYPYYEKIKTLMNEKGILAKMATDIEIKY